jgi:hypothetical protein
LVGIGPILPFRLTCDAAARPAEADIRAFSILTEADRLPRGFSCPSFRSLDNIWEHAEAIRKVFDSQNWDIQVEQKLGASRTCE